MWKKLQAAEGKIKRPPLHPFPEQHSQQLIRNFVNRAKTDNLDQATLDNLSILNPIRIDALQRAISIPDEETDKEFSFQEFNYALKSKKTTAPGNDGIIFSVLKNLSPYFKMRLLHVFNMSLNEGKLPDYWKQAIIHCIPKPSDPLHPRPISLLLVADKLMETMIHSRLLYKIGSFNGNLRGFIRRRSTSDCITSVLAKTTEYNKNSARRPILVFLDLEKAYELANRLALTELLITTGVKGKLLSWLADYLLDRKAQVRFQGHYSDLLTFENGTPQGSVISPTLFNLLMEYIVCQPYHMSTTVLSYADDLVLINTLQRKHIIQRDLRLIEKSCQHLGLKISAKKSKAMIMFSRKMPTFSLRIQGSDLDWVNNYKYLGIIIDRHLTFNAHIKVLHKRVTQRLAFMKRLTSKTAGASYAVLKTYYTAAIRSLIEYMFPITLMISQTNIKKLNIMQNKALRIMTRSFNWTNHTGLEQFTNIEPLFSRQCKHMLKVADKTLSDLSHPNHKELIKHITNNDRHNNKRDWNQRLTDIWNEAYCEVPKPMSFSSRAPWELDACNFVIQLPDTNKADSDPHLLKSRAMELIDIYCLPDDIKIYTDGSVDPVKKTAGCAFYLRHGPTRLLKSFRLKNNASTLQTELIAINLALKAASSLPTHDRVTLLTDSLSALHVINTLHNTDNIDIINDIKNCFRHFQHLTSVWVPSHTDIPGNEIADQLAKKALKHSKIDIELPLSSYSQRVKYIADYSQLLINMNRNNENESNSSYALIYHATKGKSPTAYPSSTVDNLNFAYFFLQYKLPMEQEFFQIDNKCPDCGNQYSIRHHFLTCPQHSDETQQFNLLATEPRDQMVELTQLALNNPNIIASFCRKHPIPRSNTSPTYLNNSTQTHCQPTVPGDSSTAH